MKFTKKGKCLETIEVFPTIESFTVHLKQLTDKINFDSDLIKEKMEIVYKKLVKLNETTPYHLFYKKINNLFGFKYSKNYRSVNYWLERGWTQLESEDKIEQLRLEYYDTIKRNAYSEYDKIIFDGLYYSIFFGIATFIDNKPPKCGLCKSILKLERFLTTEQTIGYKIIGCSNNSCDSNNMNTKNKYNIFIPDEFQQDVLKKRTEEKRTQSKFCIEYWIKRGYSEDEGKQEISKIQSTISKQKTEYTPITKESLLTSGYTEDGVEVFFKERSRLCIEYWIKRVIAKMRENKKYQKYKKRIVNITKLNELNPLGCIQQLQHPKLGIG